MEVLSYDRIAFILIEVSALFLTVGLIWFTAPFRKRKRTEDILFFILELLCVGSIISDISLYIVRYNEKLIIPMPFPRRYFAILAAVSIIADYLFFAVWFLYALSLLKRGPELLRRFTIPAIAVAIFNRLVIVFLVKLPDEYKGNPVYSNLSAVAELLYYVMPALVLVVLLFVDKKLVLYYAFFYTVWFIMSQIIPIFEYSGLLLALTLVFTYIIVIKRELFTERLRSREEKKQL